VAGASALDGYAHSQTVEYAACDQAVYQQDLVIHRAAGSAYEETVGGLNVWHLYVGTDCQADYGDVRFTDASGTELSYYLWSDLTSSEAQFCVRLTEANAAESLVVWYGGAGATTTSNGDATYLFFDDFPGSTLNATLWRHWHTYAVAGIYAATLTVGNSTWNQAAEIEIVVEPPGVVPLPTDAEMML
jgi:hypothetical protein